MRFFYLIPLFFYLLAFPQQIKANAPQNIREATSQEVFTLLKESSIPYIILDIRTPKEFFEGHLAKAQLLNFFDSDFQEKLAKLDKAAPYILYCRTGKRSSLVFSYMKKLDFQHVIHMYDGIVGWKKRNFPLVK